MSSVRAMTCVFLAARGVLVESYEKVKLTDIQALTLRHGAMTTGRRASPVPQTSCVGGSARGKYTPSVIQCKNAGHDGFDVQWECRADLDNAYRFGETTVVCEGYDYPEDPYVLRGSCGVEYTLELTAEGREQEANRYHSDSGYGDERHRSTGGYAGSSYGSGGSWGSGSNYESGYGSRYGAASSLPSSGGGGIFGLIVMGLVIYGLVQACFGGSGGGGGYGGPGYGDGTGGGGGWGGPGWGGGPGGPGGYYGGKAPGPAGAGGGWGNFWTGLAAGGMMGNLFGGGWGGGYGGFRRPGYGYGGGMFGNLFGNRGYGNGYGYGNQYNRGYGMAGGTATRPARPVPRSTGTRTASGFGGTRRR